MTDERTDCLAAKLGAANRGRVVHRMLDVVNAGDVVIEHAPAVQFAEDAARVKLPEASINLAEFISDCDRSRVVGVETTHALKRNPPARRPIEE